MTKEKAERGCGCGTPSEDDVRKAVRERYTRVAQRDGSCCGTDAETMCRCGGIYPSADLVSVPMDAQVASAGCGNPMAIADLKPGMVVVDLGSGGGIDAFLASKRVGVDGKVFGIDATPEMIFRARKTAKENGFDNVEFRLGEIEHIPLDGNVADVIISNCVINLSPDKDQVFREAFRVLRPGGKLAVSDIVLLRDLPEPLRRDMAAWSACVSGALLEGEYLASIARAGFVDVSVVDKQVYTEEQLASYVSPDGSTPNLSSLVASAKVVAFKPVE
jgi:arsenite methyltransferase